MDFRAGERTKSGYLALPPGGVGPGVMVLHAWWGLNEFFVQLCDRLAAAGYVALAPDLYEGNVAITIDEAKALQSQYESNNTITPVLAAFDALAANPAVAPGGKGLLGCSMGTWWSVQLSVLRPDQVAAAVLVYGAGEADFSASRCAYQVHFAETDEWESLEQTQGIVAAMRAAGREVELYVYPGAEHWFFESNQPVYDAEAAALAWERTLAFLGRHIR